MPTAETVPPQYSPGDVVATSDGVEWMVRRVTEHTLGLIRFNGRTHNHDTKAPTEVRLSRRGDFREKPPSHDQITSCEYWWVRRDAELSLQKLFIKSGKVRYDYTPFGNGHFSDLEPYHATASYCPANAAGVALPWSSLDVAAAPVQTAQQPAKDVEFRESPIASGRLDLIEAHARVNGGRWTFEELEDKHWLSVGSDGIPWYSYSGTVKQPATGKGRVETQRQRPVLDDGTPVTWTSLERAKVVNVGDTVVCSEFSPTGDAVSIGFNPDMRRECGKEQIVKCLPRSGTVGTGTKEQGFGGYWTWPVEAVRVVRRAAKKSLTAAAISDTVPKSPITTAQIKEVKETTMPPTTAPAQTHADTLSSRFVAALKEGARRAPVEAGIDKGHEMLKELLISAVPAEGPREEGIIREYVTRLLSSNYGKAIGAYAVGELLHTVAPHLGKRAALAQAAGREFAFRAATIAEKEAGSSIIALFPKGISMLDDLLNSFAGSDSEVEVAAVQPQQLSGSTGELSRVMAAAVGGAASAEKVAV